MVPVPKIISTTPAINVVTFESKIVEKAFLNPASTDTLIDFPTLNSSLILSNIKTFASTAIPIDSRYAATTGKVIVVFIAIKLPAKRRE